MFDVKKRGRPDIFVSAKTLAAIPARHAALRTALVQASLDPSVRSIAYMASAPAGTAQVAVDLDAVVLTRDGAERLFHLDVVPARTVRSLDDEGARQIALRELGLVAFTVTADDLAAQPVADNATLVWSYRGRRVDVGLRIRILQALRDDGPLELARLLECIRSDRDPSAAIMALACDDLLELDLKSGPLGPATTTRIRS